ELRRIAVLDRPEQRLARSLRRTAARLGQQAARGERQNERKEARQHVHGDPQPSRGASKLHRKVSISPSRIRTSRTMNSQFRKTMEEIGAKTPVCFRVVFADGAEWQNHERKPDVSILIRSRRAYWRVLLFGHVGFLEAYFNGDIDIEGSMALAFRAGMDAGFDGKDTFPVRVRNWWHEVVASNATIGQAKKNARFHYGP